MCSSQRPGRAADYQPCCDRLFQHAAGFVLAFGVPFVLADTLALNRDLYWATTRSQCLPL